MKRGNLHQRLSRLEAQLAITTDGSGFAPHTDEWWNFWTTWVRKLIAGEDLRPRLLPLEVFQEMAAIYDALTEDRRKSERAKS